MQLKNKKRMNKNYILEKSFQMLRTNVSLTSNFKINVTTDMSLYLESFNSSKELNDDKYKHFSISKESYLEDKLLLFYDNLPSNIAFTTQDKNDKEIIYNKYSDQFDDLYWSGPTKIEQNKFYDEEFEYFAPLYLKYGDLPKNFIIMRIDKPGIYESNLTDYKISKTTSENFRNEIIEKWKVVKTFDLTSKSELGKWLNSNFIENKRFPKVPFEFDSNTTNFSRWYGIDYVSGSYTEKSEFLSDKIWYEQPHFRLEEYITDGFKRNELIYPNILNMNFLFDDTPATPFQLNKYSINRYMGFYVDMEQVDVLTSYLQPELKTNLKIVNNIFMENSAISGSTSPFFDTDEEWDINKNYYIYAIDDLFEVKQVKTVDGYSYNIISEYDIEITDLTSDKECNIIFEAGSSNFEYKNLIEMRNTPLILDRIITSSGVDDLYADLYLIKIDNKYHVIEYNEDDDEYLIRTDYGIRSDDKSLKYWIENESKSINILTHDTYNKLKPIVFEIYRVQFRDIKDFDYNRIDSGFADFDFDQEDEYVDTEEHKLYCVEHMDASLETKFKEYDYLTSLNPGKRIIASSEYVAGDELYEVNKYGLTKLWDKNPNITKWGYVGSISHADYPYKLNNSNKLGSIYNKITDIHNIQPRIETKTNDYFYRIGTFISGTTDGYTYEHKYFKTQSLSIETDSYSENGECIPFDLDIYLESEFDYFDYFFNNVRFINDAKEYVQTQQFSMFNSASEYSPSTTLFKGINFNIGEITDIVEDDTGEIQKILKNGNFEQYKFCIIANFSESGNTYNQIPVLRRYPNGIKYSGNLENDKINIFYNKKFKNILIILNLTGVVEGSTISHNNLTFYNKRVVYEKDVTIDTNVELMTASNFIYHLNNDDVNYYYIDENGEYGSTYDNTMLNIESWRKDFAPIQLSVRELNMLSIKKKSFNVAALKGPKTNIYDKYKTNFNQIQYDEDFIKEPLATIVTMNEEEIKPRPQYHGETLLYDKKIFRYNGEYEPIFKNIALFSPSSYHVVDGSEFLQKKCGATFDQNNVATSSDWIFPEYALDLCDNTNTFSNFLFVTAPYTDQYSNVLKITNFNFGIPRTALIKGIKVNIKKNAEVDITIPTTTNPYSEIFDEELYLLFDNINIGINKADTVNHWLNVSTITEYGGNDDLWNTALTYDIINDESFGVSIMTKVTALAPLVNNAYIDCVCIEIAYKLEGIDDIIYTTSSKRNVKFDTNLYDFGMIDSLIYSKVNEKENMLKLKDTKEDRSIYPMIDEFGYQVDKRFIFKSTWDSDYYIKTKNEIE